ncbi:MAG: caspase family protein [Elsteraceae bacterium]
MTKRAVLLHSSLILSGLLFGAIAWARPALSQTFDGRYVGSFSCSVAGPNPAFNSLQTADISGGRFTLSRQTRFGPESLSGVVDASGAVSVDGGGQSDSGGPGEWRYDLKGSLRNGRLEATGRMYTRRDPNLRVCTLVLNRAAPPAQTEQAARKPEQPDPLAAALLENERRQKVEEEAKAKQVAEERARQDSDQRRKIEAEQKQKAEADAKARQAAEAKARAESEQRKAAEERQRADAEAKAKQLAEARAKAETDQRKAAEERQKAEAEAKAKQLAEAALKAEAEAKARQIAEAKAKTEAEQRKAAEEKQKAEADAKAKQLAEAAAKAEAERKKAAEERQKAEAEAKARQVAEARAQAEAEQRKAAEERLKAEAEAKAKQLAEAAAKAEAEQKRAAEEGRRAEAEAKARQLAEARAKAEAEQKKAAEEQAARERKELEERVRLAEQRAKEAEDKATRTAVAALPPAPAAPPASTSASTRVATAPQPADLLFSKVGTEQRVALVIGNSAYQHTPKLDNPQTDARAMAAALSKTGFELIGGGPLLDLDKAKLERAIYDFSRRLRQGTVGMFYYAGHGFEVGGRNYLAPVDANPTSTRDIDFMLVDVDLLLRQLRDADSRLNMVVLDACRNNPFGGAGLRGGGGLAEIKSRPSGTIISFATAAGEVARDGPPGQNSPYTAALVAAIQKPGLSVLETFNDVAVSVQRATNREQQPWIQSTGIQGQFFFVPPTNVAPSVAAPAGGAMDRDALFWSSVKDSRDPAQLQAYLSQFPNGVYAPLARIWIEDAKRAAQPKP